MSKGGGGDQMSNFSKIQKAQIIQEKEIMGYFWGIFLGRIPLDW